MKIKHKGKVFPSPSASSPPPPCDGGDPLSLLLPATILTLASVLSLEDRQVLTYMITRSVKTPTTASTSKKASRKQGSGSAGTTTAAAHKPPLFDCDCFDCYTSYWYRWDSSPNRELIHQVIEAFEEHLSSGELSKKNGGQGKRKEKPSRRREKSKVVSGQLEIVVAPQTPESREASNEAAGRLSPRLVSPEKEVVVLPMTSPEDREEGLAVVAAAESGHKGLARKVLPDVMGLLNCRLWNLWNPTV